MFKIYDGRTHFYQWDLDRKLIVEDASITQVHFCNRLNNCSIMRFVYEVNGMHLVDVPNIILQESFRLNVYGYDKNYTKHSDNFEIAARSKPEDYIYTEEEVLLFEELNERLTALEEEGLGALVDLSGYYTKEETDAAIAEAVGAIEFPELPETDLSNYYTKAETEKLVEDAVGAIEIPEGENVDLSNYYTKDETNAAIQSAKPDLEPYALKSQIPSLEGYAKTTDIPDVSAYQTEAQVNALINTALGVIENGTY